MREVDDLKVSYIFLIKKTGYVLRKRLFFNKRFRLSEPVLFFSGNLWKILPTKKIKTVYYFLDRLVDEILWF